MSTARCKVWSAKLNACCIYEGEWLLEPTFASSLPSGAFQDAGSCTPLGAVCTHACTTLSMPAHNFRELLPDAALKAIEREAAAYRLQSSVIRLEDIQVQAVIGHGNFGRVGLVKHLPTGATYALKCLNRKRLERGSQKSHIMSERAVMMRLNHPFIVQLHATMKNSISLFMLLEVSLGGDLRFMLLIRYVSRHHGKSVRYS